MNKSLITYDQIQAQKELKDYTENCANSINKRVKTYSNILFSVIQYESLVDGTTPLYANAVYNKNLSGPLPVMIMIHGYSANRSNMNFEQVWGAQRGFFVISPDLRGRGIASPISPYCDYPPVPFPLSLLKAELNIFFEKEKIPSELVFIYCQDKIKEAISEKAHKILMKE